MSPSQQLNKLQEENLSKKRKTANFTAPSLQRRKKIRKTKLLMQTGSNKEKTIKKSRKE